MESIINPLVLYLVCALGALALALALPRRNDKLAIVGGVTLAITLGLAALGLASAAKSSAQDTPNAFFYIFALIALASSARVITHPRPVYSALYFILSIIASAGLYILLSAEFMAFALVIIYAGAILITYLFVIMLATQQPTESSREVLDETDAVAREPILACTIGFVMLAVLTSAIFNGLGDIRPPRAVETARDSVLVQLPRKVDRILHRADAINPDERVARASDGTAMLDIAARTITVENQDLGTTRVLGPDQWPQTLRAGNLDRLGYNLMHDHPMTIEIAGVILLMAMLGATVLARKHMELEDELKAAQARKLGPSLTLPPRRKGAPRGGDA